MRWWRKRHTPSRQTPETAGRDQAPPAAQPAQKRRADEAHSGPKRGFPLQKSPKNSPSAEHVGLTTQSDAPTDNLLDFQHFLLRRHLKANHQSPLQDPQYILDVGCGTGRWVVEMAAEFPNAKVVGLDLVSPRDTAPMLAPLGPRAANVSFVEADLLAGLPFPAATFDFVHLRLMFTELPASRWPDVMRDLVRVTRPWGWVECIEPSQEVYGPGPAYAVVSYWVAELCRRRGLDPNAGPKLMQWQRSAGLVSVAERQAVLFPDVTLTRERRLYMTQSLGVFDLLRAPILEAGITSPAQFDAAYQAVRREFEQNTYPSCDVLHIVFGQKPPS